MQSIQLGLWIVIVLVLAALIFDFMNGFHDAANSIATVISTGVLKPQQAVAFASIFNVIAYFIFHLRVAKTIGSGMIDASIVDHYILFGALTGAICWNVITWRYGIPSSSSHALVGGLVGPAIAKAGWISLNVQSLLKTILFIFISPLLGFLLSTLCILGISWYYFRTAPSKVSLLFRRLQLLSAGLYSLGHGGNDAQKTIGIIWMILVATGYVSENLDAPPVWVIPTCYAAMGLGTLSGGWRIVATMGNKLTKLRPVGGFCAEMGGAITLFIASFLGIPVSTTHTITGGIIGVGATQKFSAVRWNIARKIVLSWFLTIPASAIIASSFWWIAKKIF
ncbi:MAG: anion permease [Burkholderia sp.]|nr:anion permease [Burkholderia sp.]